MSSTLELPKKKAGRHREDRWNPPRFHWSKSDVKRYFELSDYRLVNYWVENGYLPKQFLPGKTHPVFLTEDVEALRQNKPYPKKAS